ncbi:exodeoxyribonuclease VII small subunit [Agromyces sp. ZXT2-3]|uniref:exodeoxyribonuclease VII small subunit n=1 Tax=Agromyces sp. ZXT2-3 TaxID=3461152 RepID=UPI0040552F1D
MPSMPPASTDVAELSYEQARDELVRVVAELEQGSATLEQSLALWERGEALAQRCEEWLVGAKARLDAARAGADGGAAASGRPTGSRAASTAPADALDLDGGEA